MIKTIGVYGDSFAIDSKYSWINYLRQNLKCEITSYGQVGTDLMFSYSNFLENHNNYDLNIFIITDSTRDHLFEEDKNGKPVYKYLKNSLHNNVYIRKIIEATEKKRALFPWSYYYRLVAVIDSLKARDPKIIIINGMDTYCKEKLFNIQNLDGDKFYGINSNLLENQDRCCHMSPIQNKEFAGYLTRHIIDGFDVFNTLSPENVSKYYTQSATKQEAGFR